MGRILLVSIALFNVLPLLAITGTPALAGAIAYGGQLGNATSPPCPTPGSVSITADADTFIEQAVPSANHGAGLEMVVASPANTRRSLIHFPLPAIPADCALAEARLEMNQVRGGTVTQSVERATSAWSESTTWNTRPSSTGAPITVATSDGAVNWRVTSVVRGMYANTNHGFVISQPDPSETAAAHYQTRENLIPPKLTLTWGDTSGTSLSVNVSSAVPDGNSVVVSFGTEAWAFGAVSATDSRGNTYSVDSDSTNFWGGRTVILSAHDVKGLSAGDTITVTHPLAYSRGMSVNHFSGLAPTNTRDGSSTGVGISTSPNAGSVSTSQPNELVIGSFSVSDGSPTFSAGAGYTSTGPIDIPGGGGLYTEYLIASSAGSYSANGSLSASVPWAGAMATYKMDIDAPVVTVTSPTANQSLSDTTPTISGTSSSNDSDSKDINVTIYSGAGTGGSVVQSFTSTRAADGTWSGDTTPLADGTYTVQATQQDGGNNVGASTPVTFSLDTTVDMPSLAAPASPSNDTSPEWTFSGEPNATFECKLEKGGVVIAPLNSCLSPVQHNLVDGDGTYTFFVRQIDAAGNNSPFAWSDYVLDTGNPNTPEITGPGNVGNETNVALTFNLEQNAAAECKIEKGGQLIQGFTSCSSPEIITLVDGDGTYTFTVRQTDAAGNVSGGASQDYKLDTAVPGTTITSGPQGPTSNPDPSFDFSSDEAGVSFECELDGAGFTPCTSPQSYASLGDGDHIFRVRAVDDAGNVDATPGEHTFNVDTGAPTVTIDSGPSDPGNDETPGWTFSSEAGATFECELTSGGQTLSAFADCGSGDVQYDLSGESDGIYTFTVRVEDAAGNSSMATDTYVLDTKDPESASTSTPLSSQTNLTIAYASSDDSGVQEVELWARGPGETEFALADTDSTPDSASFDYTATQGDGWYRFYTRAVDAAGNREDAPADADSITVVDTQAPDVSIDSAPPTATATSPFGFSFSSTDPTATFECSLTGDGSDDYAPCGDPTSYADDGDGTYVFKVRATDPAGNTSAPATHAFWMDATPPEMPTVEGPPTPGNNTSPEWTFSGEAQATFECRVEKGGVEVKTLGPCSSPREYNLTDGDGSYTFFVRQRDEAGNVSPFAWNEYVLDTDAPNAADISGPSGPGNNTDVALTFDSGDMTVAECRLEKDAQVVDEWRSCTSPEPYTLADGDGRYTFSVLLTDGAGNKSPQASVDYDLDTSVPDTQIDSGPSGLTNNASPSYAFSSDENGVEFECELDGAGFTPCDSPENLSSLSDGDHTFRVRAFDRAGNVDATPARRSITVDTGAPPVSIDADPVDPGNDARPRWDFSTESGAGLECELSFGGQVLVPFEACNSGTIAYDLQSDGSYTFSVRATDAAGNSATTADTYTFDTGLPDSAAWSTGMTSDANFDITYTFADGLSDVVEVELWAKGPNDGGFSLVETDTSPDTPSFAYVATQGDGTYEFYTRSLDEAGNREVSPANPDSVTVLDTSPADITIDSTPDNPTDTSPFEFTFSSSDPEAAYECSLTTDGSDDYIPCASPVTYPDSGVATYTFKVHTIDLVGNVGEPATYGFDFVEPEETVTDDPSPSISPSPSETPSPSPTPTITVTPTQPPTDPPTVAPTVGPSEPPPPPPAEAPEEVVVVEEPKAPRGEPKEKAEEPNEPREPRREDPAPVPPPDDTDNGDEEPDLADLVTATAKAFGFPLLLALLVAAYLMIQYWLDRKDPKLAMAPVHAKHDLAMFV